MVKCLFCGKMFDAQEDGRDKIWYKPRANRYAHIECGKQHEANKTQDEKDYNFTFNGMYYTLIYFYEVKKNSKEKFINGSIGIIPFCYKDAENYYYNIYIASKRAGTGDYDSTRSRSIDIPPPAARIKPPKLFNLDMEDDDEE